MRSLLFVPGDSEKKLGKATASGADVLILDLEDSVALGRKEIARAMVADFVSSNKNHRTTQLYVRINALDSELADGDLEAVIAAAPDGIMLPKSVGGPDVEHLSAKLNVHEAEAGLPEGSTAILPIITETAAATLAGGTYLQTSERLAAVTWGAEDLSAAIGARTTRDENGVYTDVFRYARTITILAGSAAGVASVDTVFINFRDDNGLRLECVEAERDGFTGKMAIHPAQVPIINEAFTPTTEAVAQATMIVQTFKDAGDPGVVGIDGQMYDRPHLKRAERILERAIAAGAV